MTRVKKLVAALLVLSGVLLVTTPANAGLILDITNSGGSALFTLSGSDTVASGSSNINGVWVHGVGAMFASMPADGAYALNSGSGQITNTQHGTAAIFDVYVDVNGGCCQFGLRDGTGGILSTGDAISWIGSFTTGLSFSVFNPGSYQFAAINANCCGGAATLTDGITINIGAVPSPATLALLGAGLFVIGIRQRRRRA